MVIKGTQSASTDIDCVCVSPCNDHATPLTQAQVTALAGCTVVNGNISIEQSVEDISASGSVTWVMGDLGISRTVLTSLSGFDNLHTIDGTLVIFRNEALTSLGALGRLTSAAGWRLNAKTRVTKRLWLSIAAYLCLAVAMIGIGYVLNRALDHGNGG